MNNATKRSNSTLGVISLIIALVIGGGFVFAVLLVLLTRDSDKLFLWSFPTFALALIGIVTGAIAGFTKRAWLGLALNVLLLIFDIGVILFEVIKGTVGAYR